MNVAAGQQSQQADNNQVYRDDIVQQSRHHENQDASDTIGPIVRCRFIVTSRLHSSVQTVANDTCLCRSRCHGIFRLMHTV